MRVGPELLSSSRRPTLICQRLTYRRSVLNNTLGGACVCRVQLSDRSTTVGLWRSVAAVPPTHRDSCWRFNCELSSRVMKRKEDVDKWFITRPVYIYTVSQSLSIIGKNSAKWSLCIIEFLCSNSFSVVTDFSKRANSVQNLFIYYFWHGWISSYNRIQKLTYI